MAISFKKSVALVGCGDWGKNIAHTLAKLDQLGCIIDNSPKAEKISAELKVPHGSFEEALRDPALPFVVIATPSPTHFSLAQEALGHGKHVLVEKPLAGSFEEIEKLQSLAAEKNVILMAGHLLLYHSAFQRLVDWVQTGKLGDLVSIETNRKNFGKIHAHESVLWDLGPHDFSMVLSLLGSQMPDRVFSWGKDCVYAGKSDLQSIVLASSKGPMTQINLSRLHPVKEQSIIVVGSRGMAVFDDTKPWSDKLVFYPNIFMPNRESLEKKAPEKEPLDPSEPLREELLHFLKCGHEKISPLSSAHQAKAVLTLIHAAEEAQQNKTWISL